MRLAVAAITLMLGGHAAHAAQPVAIGQTISGTLAKGDSTLANGELTDTYTLSGRAGQRISIRMRSAEFDTYLMIRGPGDFSEDNDDASSTDRDALLDVRLPADGTYRIIATSYEAASGRYSLSVAPGGSGTSTASSSTTRNPIVPGQTVQGELGGGDIRLESGEYQDIWRLSARRGERFVARLTSSAFDPYLVVRGAGDLSEDNDDDATARGSHNSRIEFTAAADGEIRIGATSYKPGETGRYALTLERAGSGTAAPPPASRPAADGTIAIGGSVAGRLAQGDSQLTSGEYYDTYTIEGLRGQRVELRLGATDFDPYLMVTGPGDLSLQNDDDADGHGSHDSRLSVTFPADGRYRISVTSYKPGEAGAYRLTATAGSGGTSGTTTATRPATGTMAIGQAMSGALARGDATLDSGEYYDRYRFTGRRGQRVAIDLTSSAFDAYLILKPPSGEQRANDDAGQGDTRDSRIELALPEDGEYTVMVTSYRAGETGSYQFSIKPSEGTVRMQAARTGPRVFALMIGISDYGNGGRANLPYTAQDATKLAETLRRAGVLNPASVTLTDAQATRAGVETAFARVAAQAGPEDVFLFFYSGHGGQEPAPNNPTELDGRGETLVLRDGALDDEALKRLFGTLRTRMALLVLDSCFSGGFARNVVSRPGVMGLFSSEEDLTSSVAEKFRAGGYLSHFVREGLAGDADADGDRIITAGELAAFVRAQFAREAHDVEAETSDGQRNYQNLVIDRGGVQVDDALVRLLPR